MLRYYSGCILDEAKSLVHEFGLIPQNNQCDKQYQDQVHFTSLINLKKLKQKLKKIRLIPKNNKKMNVTETLEEAAYFTGIDYAVFAVLLSGSLSVGIYFGFFSDELKTAEDYLVGGHQMRTIPIAISLVSSQLSAISIMTIPVEIYSYGWQYMLLLPTLFFIVVATNYLFLPVFYQNNIENCYVVSSPCLSSISLCKNKEFRDHITRNDIERRLLSIFLYFFIAVS